MCGIAGWYTARRDADAAPLTRMLQCMIPRGPDDCGESAILPRTGGQLLLGARRLAILDLSLAGHQPMRDPETGNQIVYNGEIYNFRELRSELESRGCHFLSQSDTEVILHGYRTWGGEVVTRLRGMFAVALWDEAQQSLWLARDRLGIKPLYYAQSGGDFLFASETRALAASGIIPRELDAAGLDSLLQFGSVQEPATLLRGVRILPAGHTLRWQTGTKRLDLRSYWSLPVCDAQTNGTGTLAKAATSLRYQLEQATDLHLLSDVPVGVFLSGGLDSSAIAALAVRRQRPLASFCLTFPEREYAEGDAARRVAERLGCPHHEAVLQHGDVDAAVPRAVAALDQPTVDGVNTWLVARIAREAGVRVVLSGLGSDELFAGYDSFRRVPRLERVGRLPRWSRSFAAATLDSRFFPARAQRVAAWLREEDTFGHPYFATRMLLPSAHVARLLQPEWILAADNEVFASTAAEYRRLLATQDPVNRTSALELAVYLRNTVLRDTDCASMAHSVEVRVPFLDHKVVESALRMPGGWKLNGTRGKPLLAAAVGSLLPGEVLHRSKRGFELPWNSWLRGPLRAEVEASLAAPGPVLAPVLRWPQVQELWRGFLAGRVHWSRPWLFHVLKTWCDRHIG